MARSVLAMASSSTTRCGRLLSSEIALGTAFGSMPKGSFWEAPRVGRLSFIGEGASAVDADIEAPEESAVSSVIGRPLRTGSCLGFLSAAAVAVGISTPKERKVLKERKHARRAWGVMRTRAWYSGEASLKRWRGDFSITPRLTLRSGKSCWAKGWCGLRM